MKFFNYSIIIIFAIQLLSFGQTIAVVVHKDNPINDISKRDLRRIFLSDMQRWSDGQNIMALTYPTDSKERELFQNKIIGLSIDELRKYYSDEQIKGKSIKQPTVQNSAKAVQLFISRVPMAIGYVNKEELMPDQIKIITIDGKSIDDDDYPIK